ncbi:MAG TPA: glycosyltransferase family 4 protein [Balneolaceae bacterium]|nr:glycosyltransferase family 4 protein [Balneolaceae bacterium]
MSNIIFTHPTGNANVRATAKGLENAGFLHQFNTTVAVFPNEFLYKLGALSPLTEIRKRSYHASLKPVTKRYPFRELGRLMASKIGWKQLVKHETGIFCIDQVCLKLDQTVAAKLKKEQKQGVTGVYAYEDGAAQSFKKATELGLACLYDLPIGYWRAKQRLLSQAREEHPQWGATMSGFRDSDAKLARKDKELELADHIFVASSFTAKTLEDYPGNLAPVHVIPYGFPEVLPGREYQPLDDRKLKILFVGGLSERKGIAELFEAVDALVDKIELTVVGQKPAEDCKVLNQNLAKHRYIPSLPHDEVLELMRGQDLFLFPSLFEGFGLVITEAMSQGTPVITTNRTAGPDLITHGQDGWLIKAGSSEAIVDQVEEILQQPECLERVGRAAMERAEQRPWEVYGRELAEKVMECSPS